ncbi:cold-shock protein, DNA-binding protein [Actinoplanes sp. SE50]|uniref:cold-shock protein, DNA-binding protein n=1 Tax=unclassified Actinoplanes TaxID=2626549 RepID=UPI00023EC855|nr:MULTISPECIES: cold-shock protein, DNA-binding protein [unclassified Actinoplanes]AEV87051.1 cold-shock protein, DNA-binding protein [Actinoplanes sp. SE50/110]ATO85449.1 cold-shock protein, DNA-binding protein [Actinoplanes sp. SE50]SLM02861.1 hypothetical protein ACSP50_6146 [Actinoplanes sp. SE50/110]
MDLDLVQAVAKVGDFIYVYQTTGHQIAGTLATLSMSHLVVEEQGTGIKHAVALASIITVTTGQPQKATAAEPIPPNASVPPPVEPAARIPEAPPVIPRLIVPSGAATIIMQRPLAAPDFVTYANDELFNVHSHEAALDRVRQQLEYAVRVKELDPRFGRCTSMATEMDQILLGEPHSSSAFRLAGYLHYMAGHLQTASDRYLSAALIVPDVAPYWWLDTAIAALRADRVDIARQGLIRYIDGTTPQEDPDAWWALLALCERLGAAGLLHLIRPEAEATPEVRRSVLEACHSLASSAGDVELAARAAKMLQNGPEAAVLSVPTLPSLDMPARINPKSVTPRIVPAPPPQRPLPPPAKPATRQRRAERNEYDQAKYLEHRAKDLERAKMAYRDAIRKNINAESAIKDLAWLTRRVDGPEAALQVIEEEFADRLPPSASLDQILIDFYMGSQRYEDALRLLEPMLAGHLEAGQRKVVLRRICQAKLSLSQDATPYAEELLRVAPSEASARRTYAIALMRRDQPGDLDQAEEVIEELRSKEDAQALEIVDKIRQMREGGSTADLDLLVRRLSDIRFEAISDFGQYILDNFAEAADGIRQQRKFAANDIRYLRTRAQEARNKRSRERYDAYISAARIELEVSTVDGGGSESAERNAQAFFDLLLRGLTALGDTMLSTNTEVAREIYFEALALADQLRQPTMQEYWNALQRYLRSIFDSPESLTVSHDRGGNSSLSAAEVGAALADDLREVPEQSVQQLFEAVDELAARTRFASESAIRAIEHVPSLARAARRHLAEFLDLRSPDVTTERVIEAWREAGLRRQSDRDEIEQQLRLLHGLEVGEVSLDRAFTVLDNLHSERTVALAVDREACRKLQTNFRLLQYGLKEPGFEEREFRYLQVQGAMRDFAEQVKAAPTRLAVRNLLPIASRTLAQVDKTLERLYADREPDPTLSLALVEYTPDLHNRITVQVKLYNEPSCAPVESPELVVNLAAAADGIKVLDVVKSVPTVRGGDAKISSIQVELSKELVASGAFSLPIDVTYRTRTNEKGRISATLAVRLMSEADFTKISPNPFKDGAAGRTVTDPDMFFGREELVDQIEALLVEATGPGAGVAIYGQKRAGKSSIRLHLSRRLEKSDRFLVVDVANIGQLAPVSVGEANATLQILLWTILTKADAVVRQRSAALGDPIEFLPADLPRDEFLTSRVPVGDFITVFERFNAEAARHSEWRDRAFIVLMDEFQFIATWIAEGRVSSTFVQALKAVLEQRLFHLVVVGLDAMQSFIDKYANEFGVFDKRRVNYLEPRYALELMDRPIRIGGPDGESRYRERAQEQILSLTGGNPFYIQRFCYQLVEHMNSSKAPLVTEADVELVREWLLNEFGPGDFDNLETSGEPSTTAIATEAVREVLTAVAVAANDGRATIEDVERRCSVPNVVSILKDLEAREVVVQEAGAYRILVRLYHDWLRRRVA